MVQGVRSKKSDAGCTHSRYTLKLSLIFLINELINQQSISRTAHPPLKNFLVQKGGNKRRKEEIKCLEHRKDGDAIFLEK